MVGAAAPLSDALTIPAFLMPGTNCTTAAKARAAGTSQARFSSLGCATPSAALSEPPRTLYDPHTRRLDLDARPEYVCMVLSRRVSEDPPGRTKLLELYNTLYAHSTKSELSEYDPLNSANLQHLAGNCLDEMHSRNIQ